VPFRLVPPSGEGLPRIRSVPCSMRVARQGGRFTGLHLATCPAPRASGIQRSEVHLGYRHSAEPL
jgi:hypothetical protein